MDLSSPPKSPSLQTQQKALKCQFRIFFCENEVANNHEENQAYMKKVGQPFVVLYENLLYLVIFLLRIFSYCTNYLKGIGKLLFSFSQKVFFSIEPY